MSGPGLIEDHLAQLAARLPAAIVADLSDGLMETYDRHRQRGLTPARAAECAVREFGDPDALAAAFVAVLPARRAARRLLMSGPLVGACWAFALLSEPARPVGVLPWTVLGVVVLAVIAVLAAGALGRQYARVRNSGL